MYRCIEPYGKDKVGTSTCSSPMPEFFCTGPAPNLLCPTCNSQGECQAFPGASLRSAGEHRGLTSAAPTWWAAPSQLGRNQAGAKPCGEVKGELSQLGGQLCPSLGDIGLAPSSRGRQGRMSWLVGAALFQPGGRLGWPQACGGRWGAVPAGPEMAPSPTCLWGSGPARSPPLSGMKLPAQLGKLPCALPPKTLDIASQNNVMQIILDFSHAKAERFHGLKSEVPTLVSLILFSHW